MATQTTGGGSTTSFTNTPQANSDTYDYIENVLYGDATLYNQASKTIYLNVLSNDLGGNAKSLFSIDDGTGALTDLLTSNVTTGWEQTVDGNWIRINAGKIEFKIGDGSCDVNNARDVNSLNFGENIDDTFLYAIRLGNGTIAYATVHITISGQNDDATITGTSTGDVTEDAVPNTVSGTLVVTDPDAGQNELQPVAAGTAGDNGHGTFQVNADGTWTYTLDNGGTAVDGLDDGESLTDTITVWSEDGTASKQITVTIHGADDQPTLDAVTSGSIAEDAEASTTTVSGLSGTLTGHDVDGDTLTYGITGGGSDNSHVGYDTSLAGAYGTLYVNSLTGAYLYVPDAAAVEALDDGDTPTDSFTLTVNDGDGPDVTQTFTINLNGANDAPVSGGADSASGSEDDASIGGNVPAASDVDGDSVSYALVAGSVEIDGVAAADGTVTVSADGSYSYNPAGDQDLDDGETRVITFSYVANDGTANSAPATVTITVNGANDAPVSGGADSASGSEDDSSITGTVPAASDVGAELLSYDLEAV
jgi:VCBS repeat-containing protein